MANLHLVTGYKGSAHITSADQGAINGYTIGTGEYVLTKGRRFEAQIISNNIVRIYDGCLLMNGRYVTLDSGSYLDATISNGTSGMKRNDIIVIQYEMDTDSGVESATLTVEKGAATSGTPTDPPLSSTASILDGSYLHTMPLYRVRLNGLNIEAVEPIFQVLAPMAEIQQKQNMLINGDFQCNQRGAKVYPGVKVGYTVDMWRAFNVQVDVRKDGVKLTGLSTTAQGYFTQFIQLGALKTTTYTISAMVDDVIYNFTVTPGGSAKEKNFGKFKISVLTTSTCDNDLPEFNYYDNKLKVNICPIGTSSIIVKYVDVFEGVVAYPHVKEDPGIALARCRQYVQYNPFVSPLFSTSINDTTGRYTYSIAVAINQPMRSDPRVEWCSWQYLAKDFTWVEGTAFTEYGTPHDGCKQIRLPEVSQSEAMSTTSALIQGIYGVSCEHNPNGD